MRNILHAKFGEQRKQLPTSDKVPRISPGPQLPEELEAALTKARDAWRASRGRTRTAICKLRIARRPPTLRVSMRGFMQ